MGVTVLPPSMKLDEVREAAGPVPGPGKTPGVSKVVALAAVAGGRVLAALADCARLVPATGVGVLGVGAGGQQVPELRHRSWCCVLGAAQVCMCAGTKAHGRQTAVYVPCLRAVTVLW